MTMDSPMTPPERDATDAYEAHLDEVQDTPIREPGEKAQRLIEVIIGPCTCQEADDAAIDVQEAVDHAIGHLGPAVALCYSLSDRPRGVELVDPSIVERVKGEE